MAISNMQFNPLTGLNDTNTYVDQPPNPRADLQGLLNQLRDYLNNNVVGNINNLLPVIAPQTYTAPTLLNGWANIGLGNASAGYLKDNIGFVRCTGGISSGTVTNGTVIFNLPAGFRPLAKKSFVCVSNSTYGTTSLLVASNGDVSIYANGNNSYLSLESICFKAEQ